MIDRNDGEPQRSSRTLITKPLWLTERATRAHAIKNCVTVIRALAQLIADDLSPGARNWLRLDYLQSSNTRILELLRSDLDGTSESNRREDELRTKKEVHIPSLVEFVCGALRDQSEQRGVRLVVNCVDAFIQGEVRELEEAILNVVANAVEATPRGGAVGIQTSISADGDHYWRISDTGPGMAREVLATAGLRRATRREGGTGLGLSIAAAVAQAHGGLLAIDVLHGTGTVVTFWLPGDPRAAAALAT